jgi:excisionase family DNA binding protein
MDQKFVKLDEAAEQLGLTPDRLNELREEGVLRAYRDGASWKFRSEDIEKIAAEGLPPMGSDIGSGIGSTIQMGALSIDDLDDDLEIEDELPGHGSLEIDAAPPMYEEEEFELATGSSAELSLDLGEAGSSDLDLDDAVSGDDPDSILLSEAELGDSPDRPASTIIGKADLDLGGDLELADDDNGSALESDVRLADLDDLGSDAAATGELPNVIGGQTVNFDDLEELELDLEAESSRILTPEDVSAAQQAAQAQQQASGGSSDLKLEDDFELGGSDAGLSGLSALGLDTGDSQIDPASASGPASDIPLSGLSALELDDDNEDDFVLGDGSDITLSAADSGINLSPADSGLSLDDAPLELTGSAIGSGLDIGEASGISFLGSDIASEGFELTPMAEEAGDDDDSSQVIALEEFKDQGEADDLLGGGLGTPSYAGAAAAFAPVASVQVEETQFTGWQVVFLSLCILMLGLCGIMVVDLVRNMWSWNEPYTVNSMLIDGLNSFFSFD